MAEAERPRKIQKRVCEDRISSLSDDHLIQILLHVPTKDAVTTTFLSKRWRVVWTKLPKLSYRETVTKLAKTDDKSKSVWRFLEQSLRLYDGPILKRLRIQLGPQCPIDVDVVNWVAKAIDHRVRWLTFKLLWNSEPARMPNSLYTCKTLAILTLSGKILVDVPSLVSLPLLVQLNLLYVGYKDKDSHVRLLSSCPILKHLQMLRRDVDNNMRKFTVNVPSLLRLTYSQEGEEDEEGTDGSLVIDTPNLVHLDISDYTVSSCLIEYMPRLAQATMGFGFYPSGNFRRSLSLINRVWLSLNNTMDPLCNAVNYPQLIECGVDLYDTNLCESLVVLLSNCPKLKHFTVKNSYEIDENHDPVLWNQPSYVPKCLSSQLEMFEWNDYAGREDEKKLIRYTLQHSKCLKTVEISLKSTLSAEEKQRMIEDLESVHTDVKIGSIIGLVLAHILFFKP